MHFFHNVYVDTWSRKDLTLLFYLDDGRTDVPCAFSPNNKVSSGKQTEHIFADEMTPSISQERGGGSDERSHKSIS